jgi:hypothetical protein
MSGSCEGRPLRMGPPAGPFPASSRLATVVVLPLE